MSKKYILITGSSGLIGSEAAEFFSQKGFSILGIDNNFRKKFFGDKGSILRRKKELEFILTMILDIHQKLKKFLQSIKVRLNVLFIVQLNPPTTGQEITQY